MNYKQLETFYWATKLGGFSAAAKRMNATQSTISVRISELEQSLGVKLFERQARQIRLTPFGEDLLPLAEEAMTLSTRIRHTVGQENSFSGRVKIGVGEVVASSWLPSLVAQLKESYPGIEFELVVDLTINLYRQLADGELDVAIGIGRHMAPTVKSVSVGTTPMHWIASPDLGLNDGVLSAADLAERHVFSLPRDSHQHVTLMQWFSENSYAQPTLHTCNSLSTIIALTRHGIGISVLPRILVESDLNDRTLEVLKVSDPVGHYEFFVAYDQARLRLNPAIGVILEVAPATTTFR